MITVNDHNERFILNHKPFKKFSKAAVDVIYHPEIVFSLPVSRHTDLLVHHLFGDILQPVEIPMTGHGDNICKIGLNHFVQVLQGSIKKGAVSHINSLTRQTGKVPERIKPFKPYFPEGAGPPPESGLVGMKSDCRVSVQPQDKGERRQVLQTSGIKRRLVSERIKGCEAGKICIRRTTLPRMLGEKRCNKQGSGNKRVQKRGDFLSLYFSPQHLVVHGFHLHHDHVGSVVSPGRCFYLLDVLAPGVDGQFLASVLPGADQVIGKKCQEAVTGGDYGKIGLVQNCVVDRLLQAAVFYR